MGKVSFYLDHDEVHLVRAFRDLSRDDKWRALALLRGLAEQEESAELEERAERIEGNVIPITFAARKTDHRI